MLALWRSAAVVVVLGFGSAIAEQPPDDKDNRAQLPTQKDLNQREALKLYTKALLQKREHRYLEAIRTLEEARRLDPQAAGVQKTLGLLHHLLDHEDEALSSYKKAVELDASDGETWYRFGQLLRLQSQHKESAEALTRGAKAESLADRPEVRYAVLLELGDLCEEMKDPAKAAAAFEDAWKILEKPDALIACGTIEPDQVLPRSAELLERIGRNAAQAKQYARAIAAFQKAEKIDPECKQRLSLNLSEVYFGQGDYEKALAAVDIYLESKPGGAEGYERKIAILQKLDRNVVTALAAHLDKDKSNAPLRLLYARELARSGQRKQAEAEYEMLAEKSPAPEVYRGLFGLYLQRDSGSGDRVLADFNRVLKKAAAKEESSGDAFAATQGRAMLAVLRDDPKMVKAVLESAQSKVGGGDLGVQTRLFLAVLADRTKQLDQAERLYRSCLEGDDPLGGRRDEHEVYAGLLRVLWRERKYAAIVELCEQGLKNGRFINRVLLYGDMARALSQQGKTEEALKQADKAVEAAGARENLYARRMRALLLAEMQRYDQAIEECQGLLKDYTQAEDLHDVRYALASIYSLAKKPAKAEVQLQILIENDSSDAGAHNDLGYIWADQGKNLVEAEKLIRRALEIDHKQRTTGTALEEEDEENAAFVDSLGWVLFRQGKLRAALSQLERASALPTGEDDPVVWDHLGDVYQRLEEKAKARSAYQKAVELYDAGRRRKTDDRYKEVKQKLKLLEAP